MAAPTVTVVIPVRNEVDRLEACLAAVAAQDVPPELVEVLVVDGGSSDGTVGTARRLLAGRNWARTEVLHCEAGYRSSNLNCGLAQATAPVLVRVDARSRIPSHYLRRCLELLGSRPDVAVVGGRQRALAAGSGMVQTGVARALNNRWGMGLARYRRATCSGAADTVYLGAFRTAQLRAVDGWRTEFSVNEDFDLNRRLARLGTVWFDASLTVDYLPRVTLTGLVYQYWAFGTGKARYWRLSSDRPQPRQVVLLAAPLTGLALFAGVAVGLGVVPAVVLAATVAGAAAVVEARGADGPYGGILAHICAIAVLACISGAWLSGVAAGATLNRRTAVTGPVPGSVSSRVGGAR